jgi:hypothetical protein
MNAKRRECCRQLLKNKMHNINNRFSSDLHTTSANLTTFQKCVSKGWYTYGGKCAGQ